MINPSNRKDHPNFILFCTDQQRADFLGCSGHPLLKTPHIDKIWRDGGARFTRSYVSCPQCMPNRATMMTGRMPSVHGVRTNGISLSHNANTFVDLLRVKGYRTALIGKSHLQTMLDDPPDKTPATVEMRRSKNMGEYADAWKPDPSDSYGLERSDAWRLGSSRRYLRQYYGFEHTDLCTKHGDMVGGDYYVWLRSKTLFPDKLRGPESSLQHDYVCPQAWRTAVPEELYPTRYIQDRTCEWISRIQTRNNDRPFFLMVSFPDPHHPFTPPGRYWDMYNPNAVRLPASFTANRTSTPFLQHIMDQASGDNRNEYQAMLVEEREAREAIALTCGMISMIDDAVGAVLNTLEEAGLGENTVKVFVSDHGDLMGDHKMLLKGPFHYQGLIKVPMIWNDPQSPVRTSREIDALSGTIDLSTTVLDRAGIQPFYGMQGQSLLPLIEQKQEAQRRSSILIEEEQHSGSFDREVPLRVRTLVTERYRMSVYTQQELGELYDLEADPHETENLWDNAAYSSVRSELLTAIVQQQASLTDPSPLPEKLG